MIAQSSTLGEALSPEAIAAVWARLEGLAGAIGDGETRAQYLAAWRARFDAAFPTPDPSLDDVPIVPDGRLAGLTAEERARVALIGAAWLERVAGFVPGEDNDAVKRFAWGVGRRVAADMIGEDAALAAILAKLELEELPREIARSFAAGQRKGFDCWPIVVSLRCAGHPMTDLGNAERFRDRYLDDFRFTTAKGWLGWDGRRWRVLDQEQDSTPAEVQAAVFDTIRSIQHEARSIRETGWGNETDLIYWIEKMKAKDRTDAADLGMNRLVAKGSKMVPFDAMLFAWGRTSESAGKLGCIANLAKRWLTVAIEEFDTDPFTVKVLNGTLRFERVRVDGAGRREDTGNPAGRAPGAGEDGAVPDRPVSQAPVWKAVVRLREHRREDLNTKLVLRDGCGARHLGRHADLCRGMGDRRGPDRMAGVDRDRLARLTPGARGDYPITPSADTTCRGRTEKSESVVPSFWAPRYGSAKKQLLGRGIARSISQATALAV